MTGAEAMLRTLAAGGVHVCFANPGTSEMHLVEAFDRVPEIRPVLGLFEGVLSGAADGWARMTDRPAATLFHLGPGLGNAIANLHNARRARTPLVAIVGDHTRDHLPKDPPLASDIECLARNVSGWIRRNDSASTLARDARDAVAAATAPPRAIATLIVPSDCAWGEAPEALGAPRPPERRAVSAERVREAARVLRSGEPAALYVGTLALRSRGLRAAARAAAKAGVRLLCGTFPARIERGAGSPKIERIPYFPEAATKCLAGLRHVVLAGDALPVPFFGYPTISSDVLPPGLRIHELARAEDDVVGALEALVDELGAGAVEPPLEPLARPDTAAAALDPDGVARVIARHLPENAIVSDEGVTWSLGTLNATATAPPHDWLFLTGGAIGQGVPVATGAALACPDRKVVSLQGDGSAMYTVQALWTQAREKCDVTTVLFSNREYAILGMELERMTRSKATPRTVGMLDLARPAIDWVKLAGSMGVEGERVDSVRALEQVFAAAVKTKGPRLIELALPSRHVPR